MPDASAPQIRETQPFWRTGARRSRMLVVHSSDDVDGQGRAVLDMVAGLVDSDAADVTVWLPAGESRSNLASLLRDLGARVERPRLPNLTGFGATPARALRFARSAADALHRFSERRFDLVYCATGDSLPVAALARVARVRRVVGHVHEPGGAKDRVGLRSLARACSALVADSRGALGASGLAGGRRAVLVHTCAPRRSRDFLTETVLSLLEGATRASTTVLSDDGAADRTRPPGAGLSLPVLGQKSPSDDLAVAS